MRTFYILSFLFFATAGDGTGQIEKTPAYQIPIIRNSWDRVLIKMSGEIEEARSPQTSHDRINEILWWFNARAMQLEVTIWDIGKELKTNSFRNDQQRKSDLSILLKYLKSLRPKIVELSYRLDDAIKNRKNTGHTVAGFFAQNFNSFDIHFVESMILSYNLIYCHI